MDLKQLPQSKEAEEAVLGCVFNYPNSLGDILGFLKISDFYYSQNAAVYGCMLNMFSNNIAIDIVTAAEELKKKNLIKAIGGVTYLTYLMSVTGIGYNIKNYADIVKQRSYKRQIINTANEMLNKAYDDSTDTKEIINSAEDKIYEIAENKKSKMVKIDDCLEKTINNIEKLYKNGGGLQGIPTGFNSLDRQLNGLQKGDLLILAARPSMGKTTFALNLASNIGKTNKVAFFSLEMSEEQLTQRMLSSESFTDLQKIRSGNLSLEEWDKIAKYSPFLAQRNIFIDDTAGTSVNEIKAKCKKLKIKDGLDVVIIDYLQLVEEKAQSREQEISKISRSLKKLAKELKITVIALSQLSRAPEARTDHRPMLSDLRESGAIEQDADTVMFLYRDEYYDADTEDKNIAECILAKNRNGQVGTIKLAWIGRLQKFSNLDTVHKI